MRIAVDVRELCGRPTGVGRYLSGLLEVWADNPTAQRHQWMLYAQAQPAVPERWIANVRLVPGSGGAVWEQFALPRALSAQRPDVLFAPAYTAPLTVATPTVVTVHDVSYFARPEWFSFREGTRRRVLTAWCARRARRVITDSEFSKSEIIRYIGVDQSRLRVIPLGIDQPAASRRSAVGAQADSREPIVLYAGSIFERRRVDTLIEAFDIAARQVPGATLEIVGENRTRRPHLDLDALRSRTTHADRIHIRSYVDEATLTSLYQRAAVLAFLSEYEGFGLPPLEALAAGVAPLLLDTAIARETCGIAARYVSPSATAADIAHAMAELLTNPRARREIVERGTSVLSRYDWDRAAGETLTVLEEAAIGR
jgi:glycosyltransferase involved in cell wall biosynthesis